MTPLFAMNSGPFFIVSRKSKYFPDRATSLFLSQEQKEPCKIPALRQALHHETGDFSANSGVNFDFWPIFHLLLALESSQKYRE